MNLKKAAETLVRLLPTLVLVTGGVLISAGAGMISRPAGLITGGVLLMGLAILSILGSGKDGDA